MTMLTIPQLDTYAAAAGYSGTSLSTIVAIAMAESGGNTQATNSAGNSAGTDRGVLQINSFYHSEVSDTCAFDPTCAFKESFRISQQGTSFTPWSTYGNGAYKQFLGSTSGSTTPTTPDPTSLLPSSIFPTQFLGWLSNPLRIVKMLVGMALITLALYMLIIPQAAGKVGSFIQQNPEVLAA